MQVMTCCKLRHAKQLYTKVCRPHSATFLSEYPIFQWCVVRCGSKDSHQKEICLTEIGLRAQNVLAILGSIVNIIGETYMTI